MGQVIEVRFINPDNGEVLSEEFTVTSTKNFSQTSHTAMHQEAIELALDAWSGGGGVLKRIQRDDQFNGKWTPMAGGSGSCWKYVYNCVVEGPAGTEEDNREMTAVLFTEWKEKE